MPNTQLRQHIDDMPGILAKLERIPEITTRLDLIDTLRAHALSLEPLDGVETMALSDYDRDWLVRYTYNSNAIEGSTLTLQDTSLVLEGEFVPSESPARFVFAARGVADGMAYVREYASERRELDPELIQRIHEVTALDLQPFARGTFRPYGYLARITATRVKTADPLEIHDDLQALIDGLNGSDAHPLLKAAAFHTMFENIHPFMDGNGRTGRALVQALLRHARVTTNITVPVSAGLLHDVKDYYDALTSYRRGELRPIVTAFTRAAGYAVLNGRQLVRDIEAIESDWDVRMRGLRSDAAARRVSVLALAHPVLNSDIVARELGIAPPTVFRALNALVERGVLRAANSKRRNRIWLAEPVLSALDDFAARAGRRNTAR